jgi:NAD(P)-dependent dehydrogenase (short-subunit alcohol dehydrogenase family)
VTDAHSGDGRVVAVIGASSGIGRATAHALAARGDRLVLASRSAEVLEQVRQECRTRGAGEVLVVPTDVRDADAVDALFDTAAGALGRVDAVVLTAGVLAYGRFDEVPREVFDATIATNVLGTGNVARSALRRFKEQGGGSLVVLGSVLGKMTAPLMSGYASSKWALHALVRTLQIEARELAGVHITLVSPGGVNTPIYNLAGTYTGHQGHPPPPIDPPEKAAGVIVAALDRPRREVSLGWANPVMVFGFRALPGVFDALVTPLMRMFGQTRGKVEPHPGNVLEPVADHEAVHGDWPRRLLN